jgi:hypothetical protein
VPPNEAMVEEVEEDRTCTQEVLKRIWGSGDSYSVIVYSIDTIGFN